MTYRALLIISLFFGHTRFDGLKLINPKSQQDLFDLVDTFEPHLHQQVKLN